MFTPRNQARAFYGFQIAIENIHSGACYASFVLDLVTSPGDARARSARRGERSVPSVESKELFDPFMRVEELVLTLHACVSCLFNRNVLVVD